MKKFLLIILVVFISSASLAGRIQIISDAETENTLKSFITPLVKAANLNPNEIKVRIVADPDVNAFVINRTEVFINTGLITTFANKPNIIYCVMAHELAHIYAGHMAVFRGEIDNMSKVAIGGTILGLATALAGAGDVGAAIAGASTSVATQNILSYSRMHETEADKIAIQLLYKTHNNGKGMIELFKFLGNQERTMQNFPYARTHPMSSDRIASVEEDIKNKLSGFKDNISDQTRFEFKRIADKLYAFMENPNIVIKNSKNNNYIASIGNFRIGKLNEASNLLDTIINKEPNNPYLWELKGQFNFENGKFANANDFYRRALNYLPSDNIIKLELASVQVNMANPGDTKLLNSSVKLLQQVVISEPGNIMALYMLSRAYGKLNQQIKAISALTDFYFYQGAYGKSLVLANKVIKMASPSSPEYIKASDIIAVLNQAKEKE